MEKQLHDIPIFFATDDNYIPYLDVALRSLIENASIEYHYIINVLNTGLKTENIEKVKRLENNNFTINFCDVSNHIEPIKNKLRNVYHFSLVTYYRLFIESMFPEYDKVLYLDCDIVVLGDISKLYNTPLENNLVGACREQIICSQPVFRDYTKVTMGIEPEKYFNAGVLVMNLKKFRECKIEDKFSYLINKYNFDVLDPDQAYLNVLCKDKVKHLPIGWNKESLPEPCEGALNLVHYALYKKPWQYDDVINVKYFWKYAEQSPFYEEILIRKESFNDEKKAQKEKDNEEIVEHGKQIIASEKTFYNCLFKQKNMADKLIFTETTTEFFMPTDLTDRM